MSDLRRLEDVRFTTSWKRLIYDVLKTSVKWCLCCNVVAVSMKRQKKLCFLILYCLKSLWRSCFPECFAKFLRNAILKNFCEWLLINLFYEKEPPAPKRRGSYYVIGRVFVYRSNLCKQFFQMEILVTVHLPAINLTEQVRTACISQ